MSNGGYMTYELTGYLWDVITAFSSVTGNFMLNNPDTPPPVDVSVNPLEPDQTEDYNPPRDIPFLHIHGTSDLLVNYYDNTDSSPYDGALDTQSSYGHWVNHNFGSLIDPVVMDVGLSTQRLTYSSPSSAAKVVHYKIDGGGHAWNITSDFSTDEVIIEFFDQYKLSDFDDINNDSRIDILDVAEMINQETKYTTANMSALINKIVV